MSIRTRDAVIIAGLLSIVVTWWVWGQLDPIPVVADEQSFVLQSRIFATGRWTAPPPPIAEFFEQSLVLTRPAVASKFPPGHTLLLGLGAVFGSPALMSLLLTGLTGTMLFLLARRVTNEWVAVLTTIIWLSDPINLRFRPGYYSEVTTQLLWFVTWWGLLEWRETGNRRWLLAVAVAMGWGAFTRPLTMAAFAVPVGILVVRDVARLKLWKDFGLAFAVGTLMLGMIPLWSARTTGDWRKTPLGEYTRDYLPFDKPGFGLDSTPPRRPLNETNKMTYSEFEPEHTRHTIGNLHRVAFERLSSLASSEWGGPRIVLVPFVIVGLFAMSPAIVFALLCSIALFVAHLSYGHYSGWTIYYFEGMPVLSLLAALGIWRVAMAVHARRSAGAGALPGMRTTGMLALPLAALLAYEVMVWRAEHKRTSRGHRLFRERLAQPPDVPAVIFMRYFAGPHAPPHLVRNSPHLERERIWIVNDLGPRNHELMRFAGSRIPVIFHERDFRFEIDTVLLKASRAR